MSGKEEKFRVKKASGDKYYFVLQGLFKYSPEQ
jgi:hypothetical protein